MELKCRHRSISCAIFASLFVLLLYPSQGQAEIEKNRRSNQFKTLKNKDLTTQTISGECTTHFQNWMHNISTAIFPENATIVVDWSDLDKLLVSKNCPYDHLWIELWKVNSETLEGRSEDENDNTVTDKEDIFGTPEYFSKYDRCNQLDENIFAYHSTRAHDQGRHKRYQKENKNENEAEEVEANNDGGATKIVSMESSNGPVAFEKLDPKYSTKTTFLHVVEKSYILRLCPCGKIRKLKRVCDCEYTSALCSGVINIEQPEKAKVFDWCSPMSNFKDFPQELATNEDEVVIDVPQVKVTMNSPTTTCNSVLLAGSLTPCTPVQSYDRVKVYIVAYAIYLFLH